MLCAFGHRVAMCWMLLAQIWAVSNFEPTTLNMLQHIATWWPNACNMLRPTMLRNVGLVHVFTARILPWSVTVYSDRQTRTFHRQLERVLFFTLQCKRTYFQSRKLTNIIILFWREIHSFVSINIATKHPRALICVYNRIGCTHFGNCQR